MTLVYLPHVFSMQPGTSEETSISFVAMPPTAWVDEQAAAIGDSLGSDAREAAMAAYFVAYLDARTALPIANDLRFHLELFRAAKEEPWCALSEGCDTSPGDLFAAGVSGIGFEAPVLCNVTSDVFARVLGPADGQAPSPRTTRRGDPSWHVQPPSPSAGYFPTPAHLLPSFASLMTFSLPESRSPHVLVDPCAGDGAAIIGLRNLWFGEERSSPRHNVHDAHLFLVELEKERFQAAEARLTHVSSYGGRWDTVLEADAFHVDIKPSDGASLLFLNPPYDTDAVEGRLEHRFLKRWTGCLMPGAGLLMFVVPHYALRASATFLACQFTDLRAWRFPDEDFAAFRQCVLVARRRTAALPENDLDRKRIERWSEAPEILPVLEELGAPAYGVRGEHPGLTLETIPLDVQGLVDGFRPWANSPMFGTHRSVGELIGARYEVAMPPRPAHIALALSAGMLNGKRLAPNRPGLPPLLVKGSFRRDFRVVEEKFDKDGLRTGSVQVQRPKLTLHALRLDTLAVPRASAGNGPVGRSGALRFQHRRPGRGLWGVAGPADAESVSGPP